MKFSLAASAVALLLPVFLLSACGGGSNSAGAPSSIASKTSPPQSIGFNLPATLVSTTTVNSSARSVVSEVVGKRTSLTESVPGLPVSPQALQTKSYAFDAFKRLLSDANWRRLETNVSLLYLDSIWQQIEQYCATVPVDSVCTIPANTVVFTYTQAVLDGEYALYAGQQGYFSDVELTSLRQLMNSALGLTLYVGEISYIVHSDGTFAHDVSIDLSDVEQLRQGSTVTLKQQAKWNADKSHVYTGYYFEDANNAAVTSLIDWDKTAEVIQYQEVLETSSYKTTSRSKVSRLHDGKNGVSVDSSWTDSYPDGNAFIYTSQGQMNDTGGYLESSSTAFNETYYTEETFDSNGGRTGGRYCDATTTDCSDKSNWVDDSWYEPIVDPVEPVVDTPDMVSDYVTVTNLPDSVDFFIITASTVSDPDIEDALCFGVNFSIQGTDDVDVQCWSDRLSELDGSAKIYQEVYNDSAVMGANFLSYSAVPSATVQLVQ